MADYILTKDVAKSTQQLPDKVTICMPARYGWVVLKRLLVQLEQGQDVELELYGTLRSAGRLDGRVSG